MATGRPRASLRIFESSHLTRHHHGGADGNALVQISDVGIQHADAAIETKPPTEPGMLVPWIAYSPPASVIAATPIGLRGEPPGMTSGIDGLSCFTSARRRPRRIAILAVDPGDACPLLAGLADANGITNRVTLVDAPNKVFAHWSSPRSFPANNRPGNRPRPAVPRPSTHQRPRPDGGYQRDRNPQRHQLLRFHFDRPVGA